MIQWVGFQWVCYRGVLFLTVLNLRISNQFFSLRFKLDWTSEPLVFCLNCYSDNVFNFWLLRLMCYCILVVCRDEEGSLFRIKDKNGWQVSECMNCHCKEGLLSCRRTLTINFPAYYYAMYPHKENCTQPHCNVAKFVREKRDYCEGKDSLHNTC